jgi:hypothetical protein
MLYGHIRSRQYVFFLHILYVSDMPYGRDQLRTVHDSNNSCGSDENLRKDDD